MKTPISRYRLKEHWRYNKLKYILLVCLTLLGWNIILSVTRYQPPQEKIVDLFVYAFGEDAPVNAYLDHIRQTEMSDMEQMGVMFNGQDEYSQMVLATRLAAGEGDLYVVDRTNFQSMVGEGWFMRLDDQAELQALCDERGVKLDRCWRRSANDTELHLYGIPLEALPGLRQYIYGTDEFYIGVVVNNQNDVNSLKLLNLLVRDMGPEAVLQPGTAEVGK